jgi:hypothetical protein
VYRCSRSYDTSGDAQLARLPSPKQPGSDEFGIRPWLV